MRFQSFVYRIELSESCHDFNPITKQRLGKLRYAYLCKNKTELQIFYIDADGNRVLDSGQKFRDLNGIEGDSTLSDAFAYALANGLKPIAHFLTKDGAFEYAPITRDCDPEIDYRRDNFYSNSGLLATTAVVSSDEIILATADNEPSEPVTLSEESLFPVNYRHPNYFDRRKSEATIADVKHAIGDRYNEVFADFTYDPDCAYCLRGRGHTLQDHENSVARANGFSNAGEFFAGVDA